MDILLIILGILCLIVGLAGCILPMIPGPPVAYAGLLLLHFTDKAQFSTTQLLSMAGSSRPCTDTGLFRPDAGQQI